ncbi:hypothetical protein RB195_024504 [Necator americanus]|uniref:Uncharacterized protein n=1 Tax=Necator americanus TaxID=51031 RepID=A0ABR1EP61_NECAM
MKNAYCEGGGVQLEGSQIVETLSDVYLGRSVNMKNDLKEELNRRMIRSIRSRQGRYRPTGGPRSSCPSVSTGQFFQRSVMQRRRGQTPLPRLGSYLLPTEPLRDVL